MSPRHPARLLAMVFAVAASSLVIPFIIGELKLAANLDFYDDNSWIMYGFFHNYDKSLFAHDYAADYLISFWIPPVFKALQYVWAQFADPLILHRILPILLWFSCAPLVFFTAKRIGGLANGWITLAIYLSSNVFMHRMAASLPHSFAFVFSWWMVAALVSGRPISLALCTIISAGFYPIVTPIAGITLAIWLLLPRLTPLIPLRSPVLVWPWKRKFMFLAIAGFLSILVLAPMAMNHFSNEYGRVLDPIVDSKEFPETTHYSSPPALTMLILLYYSGYSARLGGVGGFILLAVGFMVLVAGQALRDPRDRRPSSLTPFIISAAIVCLAGDFFDYSNAYRYVCYTLPVWITLSLPLAFRRISRRWFPAGKKAPAFILLALAYISCIAKIDPVASGYYWHLSDSQKHVIDFVRTLPKNTLIAGWPGYESGKIVEVLPYITRRQTLLTWEVHANHHLKYVMTLRERMNAIVDAYLAHDMSPLIALRDKFHVNYLIVNEADLMNNKPPKYFQPFDDRARKLWEEGKGKPFTVLQLVKSAGVYSRDGIDIIDLYKL